jgi:hypothetical protein
VGKSVLGKWGMEKGSGWLSGVVRGVQVVQGVSWSARNRGVRLQQLFLILAKDLHGSSSFSSFPTTKRQGERVLLQ